ncbi:Deoxyguanosinetriphosphate triphosphohydrolase [Dissulfuribacter thermophilus]|uniref:Deoxyguanosinetriphosphate triphosphohydrolase n=1 Tax=Dissulfuribacter thermophilus TaxID=1156395 RepID=A0A1B9F5W7_9BACT|nr:HD domain-containing protein [Dissulfuribacter thermophilus]OCC15161.1 Deoxyguanosinetriphosphate triphosphohydrolase [Dissulfuribacter thermophilus]
MDVQLWKKRLEAEEKKRLSPFATLSLNAQRERDEETVKQDHRTAFSIDTDRILHSLAYTRYIDKTQVFSLIPNDHITHRVLHVQIVSRISRSIGRFLGLNVDLIEAISLGHDIGHPPFGHDGEQYLSKICHSHGIGYFVHSCQGVRFLRDVERKGRGLNLTLQVLDGILCHDGERHQREISPIRGKTFSDLLKEMEEKEQNPQKDFVPTTLEACLVRMTDVISYIGRDIEDAIRLGLIDRKDIPKECRDRLGDTNGKIVYNLVEDLIQNSFDRDTISFSKEVSEILKILRAFNMERIYLNPLIKTQAKKIENLFQYLFERLLEDVKTFNKSSPIVCDFLNGMNTRYMDSTKPEEKVRDFIAGMTDAYFLRIAREMLIPEMLPAKFK